MGGDPREQELGTAVMKQRRESNSNCLQGMLDPVRPSEDPCEMYLDIAHGQKEETRFHVSHWSKVALDSNTSWLHMYEFKVVHLMQ